MESQSWNAKLHYNVFLRKLKQKNFFKENVYDKLYPSGFAPARIYGTLKMEMFSSSDSFPKFSLIVSSIGTFNYKLARFLCDLLSPLVPNDYCRSSDCRLWCLLNSFLLNHFCVLPINSSKIWFSFKSIIYSCFLVLRYSQVYTYTSRTSSQTIYQ